MTPTPARLPADLIEGPVVVKAWAPWCGSRRALAPHVDHAATTSGVPVVDLQVDADPDNLVDTFEVRSVPTLIGLRDGAVLAVASIVFNSTVLVVVGAGLLAWALTGLARRAT